MRFIDADKLIRIYFDDDEENNTFEFVPAEFIDSAPTIDAVEVVRCKECQYWEPATAESGNCNRAFEITAYATDFCSYGKRRTE